MVQHELLQPSVLDLGSGIESMVVSDSATESSVDSSVDSESGVGYESEYVVGSDPTSSVGSILGA